MSTIFILIFFFVATLAAPTSLALTAKERAIVRHAQFQLNLAQKQFAEAESKASTAIQISMEAEAHAQATDVYANDLQKEVDAAYKREKTNADLIAKYSPFWISGHKFWGLGAIGLGIGILFSHLLILAGVLIAVGVLFYVASFFFPVLGVAVSFIKSFLAKIFKRK